jgi:hypothetical protein
MFMMQTPKTFKIGDCNEYLIAPAYVSSLNPLFPWHGRGLLCAYDMMTGGSVDCPISAEQFRKTIEWEAVEKRINPKRPNPDWIKRFHLEDATADIVIQYGT